MVAQDYVPALVPRAGDIISIMLQISTFGVLSVCISKSYLVDVAEKKQIF